MTEEEAGLLILRVVYAWMFLSPVPSLLRNWPGTVKNTSLLFSWRPEWFARASIVVMVGGAFSILFDVYIRIGALGLLVFSLGGAVVHKRLARIAEKTTVSTAASSGDVQTAEQLKTLASAGHMTSAQKNYVLAAVAAYFLLQGIGNS